MKCCRLRKLLCRNIWANSKRQALYKAPLNLPKWNTASILKTGNLPSGFFHRCLMAAAPPKRTAAAYNRCFFTDNVRNSAKYVQCKKRLIALSNIQPTSRYGGKWRLYRWVTVGPLKQNYHITLRGCLKIIVKRRVVDFLLRRTLWGGSISGYVTDD